MITIGDQGVWIAEASVIVVDRFCFYESTPPIDSAANNTCSSASGLRRFLRKCFDKYTLVPSDLNFTTAYNTQVFYSE